MSTSRDQGIGRRQFLTTSACALAAVAVGPELLAGLAPAPRAITAGFAPLDIEKAVGDVFTQNVVAAETIGAADQAFVRLGASVSMLGRSGAAGRGPRALQFAANFAVEGDPEKTLPFHMWAGSGSPVRFTVPVESQRRLLFTVSTRAVTKDVSSGGEGEVALPVELSLTGGAINLQRGFYVIVPLYEGASVPNWWAYSLRRTAGRWSLVDVDGAPATFEHFVVRVDYAKDPAS
jgi:hypothetical protein